MRAVLQLKLNTILQLCIENKNHLSWLFSAVTWDNLLETFYGASFEGKCISLY